MKFAIVVPTLNAGTVWSEWLRALAVQTATPSAVLIMDSESTDNTVALAHEFGHQVMTVPRHSFDHGGTRQKAVESLPADTEIVVYLTQDAILAGPHALELILSAFDEPQVGVAYGRQLPKLAAGPIESHARLFNYPEQSQTRNYDARARLGIRAAFCSDSFAAYRRSALLGCGGFPVRTLFAEDMITAAKILKSGWKIAYVAYATVYHSHGYSLWEEFSRYFDIGATHAREHWLMDDFGDPGGEGWRFLKSEMRYLRANAPALIPVALIRTAVKLAGYRLGRAEDRISKSWKTRLSMNKGFWARQDPEMKA